MDWLELLYDVCEVCLIPLLGILTGYVIKFIRSKEKEINNNIENETAEKYVSMISQTITDCVRATTQTYVDSLKASGNFNAEAQKEAFKRSYEAILAVLSDDAKEYIVSLYGDLNTYLMARIESEVKLQK
jgi:hypothetical protein